MKPTVERGAKEERFFALLKAGKNHFLSVNEKAIQETTQFQKILCALFYSLILQPSIRHAHGASCATMQPRCGKQSTLGQSQVQCRLHRCTVTLPCSLVDTQRMSQSKANQG